jgi:hypothetical protein
MPAIYPMPIKNARLQVVVDALDAGSGPGVLVIGTAALAGAVGILASIPFLKPSMTIVDGVATLNGVPIETVGVGNGLAVKAELRDSDGNVVVSGLRVGLANTDVLISIQDVSSGQSFSVLSGTIRHL